MQRLDIHTIKARPASTNPFERFLDALTLRLWLFLNVLTLLRVAQRGIALQEALEAEDTHVVAMNVSLETRPTKKNTKATLTMQERLSPGQIEHLAELFGTPYTLDDHESLTTQETEPVTTENV